MNSVGDLQAAVRRLFSFGRSQRFVVVNTARVEVTAETFEVGREGGREGEKEGEKGVEKEDGALVSLCLSAFTKHALLFLSHTGTDSSSRWRRKRRGQHSLSRGSPGRGRAPGRTGKKKKEGGREG